MRRRRLHLSQRNGQQGQPLVDIVVRIHAAMRVRSCSWAEIRRELRISHGVTLAAPEWRAARSIAWRRPNPQRPPPASGGAFDVGKLADDVQAAVWKNPHGSVIRLMARPGHAVDFIANGLSGAARLEGGSQAERADGVRSVDQVQGIAPSFGDQLRRDHRFIHQSRIHAVVFQRLNQALWRLPAAKAPRSRPGNARGGKVRQR